MSCAVTRVHVTVFGLDQDVAAGIDQDRAERMVAVRHRAPRDIERATQEFFIEPGLIRFWMWIHDRSAVPSDHGEGRRGWQAALRLARFDAAGRSDPDRRSPSINVRP